MKNILLLILLVPALTSCVSIPGRRSGGDGILEQLRAENRLLKRNSELALRENAVLKTENERYRSEINNQKRKLERLRNDLDAMAMKYAEDTSRAEEAYDLLEGQLLSCQQECSDLNDSLTVSRQESGEKDRALAALEKVRDESRNRITLMETAAGEQERLIREQDADLQETMRQLQQAQKEIADRQATIDHLQKERNALPGSAGQADGETNTDGVSGSLGGR